MPILSTSADVPPPRARTNPPLEPQFQSSANAPSTAATISPPQPSLRHPSNRSASSCPSRARLPLGGRARPARFVRVTVDLPIDDFICLFASGPCGRRSGHPAPLASLPPRRLPARPVHRIPHRGPLARLLVRPHERQPRRLVQRPEPDELRRPTWWLMRSAIRASRAALIASPCHPPLDSGGALGLRPRSGRPLQLGLPRVAAALRRSEKLVLLELSISGLLRARIHWTVDAKSRARPV